MFHTLIIGAGQAGLAAAYYLQQAGLNYIALEAKPRVGDNWRDRWAGLRLFTPNRYNNLPGSRFPGGAYDLPDRLDAAEYLERYVAEQGLRVRTDALVLDVREHSDETFSVRLADGERLRAENLIVAAGSYRTPHRPAWAASLPEAIPALHSSQIRDPAGWANALPEGEILVVGAGASGAQLAVELSAHRAVVLAGPDTGSLPRSVLGRDVYDFLYGLGILQTRTDRFAGRLLTRRSRVGEVQVGASVGALAHANDIRRSGKITGQSEGVFATAEGEFLRGVSGVIFATGYANRYPFLAHVPGATNAAGEPVHGRGRSPVRGLWWMGLHLMRRLNSSLLGGVGRDAREIVEELRAGASARRSVVLPEVGREEHQYREQLEPPEEH